MRIVASLISSWAATCEVPRCGEKRREGSLEVRVRFQGHDVHGRPHDAQRAKVREIELAIPAASCPLLSVSIDSNTSPDESAILQVINDHWAEPAERGAAQRTVPSSCKADCTAHGPSEVLATIAGAK